MPSDFFERLQQDRRDGVAPPQIEQQQETAEPPPELEVPFFEMSESAVLRVCGVCGAAVEFATAHADWHRQIGA